MGEELNGIKNNVLYIFRNGEYEKIGSIDYVEMTDLSENDEGYSADLGVLDETLELNGEIAFIDKEAYAKLLGFKNYNCYSRYIRRIKRSREKLRRHWLKIGY